MSKGMESRRWEPQPEKKNRKSFSQRQSEWQRRGQDKKNDPRADRRKRYGAKREEQLTKARREAEVRKINKERAERRERYGNKRDKALKEVEEALEVHRLARAAKRKAEGRSSEDEGKSTRDTKKPRLDESLVSTELQSILTRANPELSLGPEAAPALEKIKAYCSNSENQPSDHKDYIASVRKALRILSPETLQEYDAKGVEFVVNDELKYPKAQKVEDKWQFHLPLKYDYPHGMMLRCIDGILTTELKNAQNVTADPARRATIMTRAFLTNMKLGEDYGWKSKDYDLAKQYHEDYYEGIRQAFEKGLINTATEENKLIETGNKYAYDQLIERTKPTDDVPGIFLSTLPGSYFEEVERFSKMKREIRGENDAVLYRVEGPVQVGTAEYGVLMEALEMRVRQGKGDCTLKVVILPNKEIWVLPYRFSGGEKSQHSIVAKGNPCVWAGEVESEGKKLKSRKRDSGHFRTDGDIETQKAIDAFFLLAFDEQGYDTSELSDEPTEE